MSVAFDVPAIGGSDKAVAAATQSPRRSWIIEFLTTPFKDIDGRAEWKKRSQLAKALKKKAA